MLATNICRHTPKYAPETILMYSELQMFQSMAVFDSLVVVVVVVVVVIVVVVLLVVVVVVVVVAVTK